jgi:hypothetical protein
MHQRHLPGLWPGLILVSLGGGLLLREFGYLPPHVRVIDFWPLFVVVLGVSSLLRARGFFGALFALAFLAMGGLLLAGNLGLIAFQAARLWPGLLVLLGLAFVIGGARRGGWYAPPPDVPPDGTYDPGGGDDRGGDLQGSAESENSTGHDVGWTEPRPRFQRERRGGRALDDDRLSKQFTFSGAQVRVESQNFKGGALGVTAGGVELDFRNARLAPEGATLDVRVVMGGVDIRVPDTWQVYCEVTPLFGGADDETRSTQGVSDAPRLRVVGTVTLGGVNIRN